MSVAFALACADDLSVGSRVIQYHSKTIKLHSNISGALHLSMFHVEIFQVLNYTVQDGEKVQGQAMFLHQEVISYFPQFARVFREGQWQLSATGGQWSA